MNILRQQDILKGVPDQRLMQEMQSPSGSVPQFLVMSEMQRRKGMRDEFTSRQESPSTVAEDLVGVEKAQAGLGPQPLGVGQSPTTIQAGLPQPAQPVMMESGGVVKYQEGTEGLTVLSDDELIAMYRSIGPDGKLNGSSRNADEVLMEVQDRQLVLGTNPYTQNVSSLTERLIKGPQALGRTDETSQPTLLGKAGDTVAPVPLASMSNNNLRSPRNIAPDSLTGGKSTLELLSEVGKENITAPSITDGSPIEGIARGLGRVPPTETFVSQGLPYSDEGLGGRDNLYRNLSDTYDRYNRRLSRNRVEEPTQVEGPPVPNVQSDTIIQRLLERQRPPKPLTGPQSPSDSNQPPIAYAGMVPPSEGYPNQIIPELSNEQILAQVDNSDIARLEAQQIAENNQPGPEDIPGFNPFGGPQFASGNLGGPLTFAQRPRPDSEVNITDIDPIVPRRTGPVNPVAPVDATLANVDFSNQGLGIDFPPNLRSELSGQLVEGKDKNEEKVKEEIKKDPAGAYEKMRKEGISDAQAMGLIMAGLGVMEAASQPGATALGSLSGAKAGVQQYSKDLQALNERIEKRRLADETTRLKEAQLDISRMQASSAKTMAEVALKKFKKGKDPSAMVEMAIAIREAERIGDTQLAATLREVMKTLGSRDPVDKSIDWEAKISSERAKYEKAQFRRDWMRLANSDPKYKDASPTEKKKIEERAKRVSMSRWEKRTFSSVYGKPQSATASGSKVNPIGFYSK
jgi:hypothetical protein